MLFEELVEQHRVHRVVAHGVDLSLVVTSYQIGVHLCYLLGDESELRRPIRVKFFLIMKGDRFEREDRFTRLVHRLDRVLETLRGGCRAKLTSGVYLNRYACNSCSADAGDKCFRLGSYRADADGIGFRSNTGVADVDVVISRGEILTG